MQISNMSGVDVRGFGNKLFKYNVHRQLIIMVNILLHGFQIINFGVISRPAATK